MAKKKDTQWLYEKRAMQNRFIAIMEYRVPIQNQQFILGKIRI